MGRLAVVPYEISYSLEYEPYVVIDGSRTALDRQYDVHLDGYGVNKVVTLLAQRLNYGCDRQLTRSVLRGLRRRLQMALLAGLALAPANPKLRVLPSAFLVHLRHPSSAAKERWLADGVDRAVKRMIWTLCSRRRKSSDGILVDSS